MNWRRALIAAAVAVPLIVLLARGMASDPTRIDSPLPGKLAPRFALATMDPAEAGADTVTLASHAGDVVVLNFWASWCLACRDEHAALSDVATRYRGRGVHFYGVLYNDVPASARRWIGEMGGQSYPTLLDPGSKTAIDYGLYGVPETFFIGRDGRVAFKQIGPVTEALLVEKIEGLLRNAGAGAGAGGGAVFGDTALASEAKR